MRSIPTSLSAKVRARRRNPGSGVTRAVWKDSRGIALVDENDSVLHVFKIPEHVLEERDGEIHLTVTLDLRETIDDADLK